MNNKIVGTIQRKLAAIAVTISLTLALGSVAQATLLSLDFGNGPVQGGYTAFNTLPSQTYGAITVTETGALGFFDSGVSGTALTDLYRDFVYNNFGASPVNLQIDGLDAHGTYDLRLYSYQFNGGTTQTTTFTPTIGTGAPGAVTYHGNIPPTTPYQYSTVVRWIADANGSLAFNMTGAGDLANSPRLNGLEINQVVPEPSTIMLLGVGGLLLRKKARNRRSR